MSLWWLDIKLLAVKGRPAGRGRGLAADRLSLQQPCGAYASPTLLKLTKATMACRLNKCGVISPRYDVKHGELEAWVARLLPSRLVSALGAQQH